MKNKLEGSMIKPYLALWNQLTASGTVKPKIHIMDNRTSEEYKKEIQKNAQSKNCMIKLVPPDNHRWNLAEQAIQTFKNHFKAILAGVDDTFPMQLWDTLLPQTILTLNFLCQSNAVLPSQHTNIYMATLTTTKCHWPQWDVQYNYMKAVRDEAHGQITQLMDGTYRHLQNTIDATKYM